MMIRGGLLFRQSAIFLVVLFFISSKLDAMSCPATTPWATPINLSNSGIVTSGIFSAGTAAGFMAVWADSSNNAHYNFSTDGSTWQTGLITPAQGDVSSGSNVFIAGNATGFIVTWVDNSNNAWSCFSTDNGNSWSAKIQINPTLVLAPSSDVYVNGGSSGFIAAIIDSSNNAWASFSDGTAAWSSPVQVTTDNSVNNSLITRQYVSVAVNGNSCMLTWLNNSDVTYSAYFESINPFEPNPVTNYPIVNVGFSESVPIVTQMNGYFMAVARVNAGAAGQTYFSVATTPSNWATFSVVAPNPSDTEAGPWVAANYTGFISAWIVGSSADSPGSPMWTLSNNNGFNWTPVCSILPTLSTTIEGPVGLSANAQGFVATWFDSNDSNAYTSFYSAPGLLPPNSLQGCKTQNRFLTQSDLINKLTWQAPASGAAPAAYKIYRNVELTDLVATVSASAPLQYFDHNRQPNIVYSYYVVCVDGSGSVSAPASVTVTQAC
ncbi:MAG: hypothetical protein K2X90_00015 [Candidatus Babeliaceae bacterium]|nr:hypothetical protein [Candidatus Babeliaceae bacterium]